MTLAALKRTIQPGTRLRVLAHWQEKYQGSERVVTKTQGNGFWFDFEGKRCWSPYPKADEITFTSERVFTVTPSDSKSWTLEIVA